MRKVIFAALLVIVSAVPQVRAQDALLRAGDAFDLRISGVPPDDQGTISGSYTVDGQGYINLSYISRRAPLLGISTSSPSRIR